MNNYKGYDLSTLEGLKKFAKDCAKAIAECPQRIHEKSILKNKYTFDYMTPEEVFKYYCKDNVLWNSGYSESLSREAIDTFKRYTIILEENKDSKLVKKVLDLHTNTKLSNNIFRELFPK